MPNAYTPGLTVSGDMIVRRTRRLPIKGEVLVREGDKVTPEQVVARAKLPGPLQTIKLAEKLGIVRAPVQRALDKLTTVPVDIEPRFTTAARLSTGA